MREHIIKTLRLIAGTLLILLGLIGLVVPIMQGWIFIIAGIVLIHPKNGQRLKGFLKEKIEKFKAWRAKKKDADAEENVF